MVGSTLHKVVPTTGPPQTWPMAQANSQLARRCGIDKASARSSSIPITLRVFIRTPLPLWGPRSKFGYAESIARASPGAV